MRPASHPTADRRRACRHVLLLLAALLGLAPAGAARAATYTWTGGGANTSWSNPANWDGNTAPANNESSVTLIFPELDGPYTSTNDRTGLVITFLQITTRAGAGTYTFTGNGIMLGGPASIANPGAGSANLVWEIPLALSNNVTMGFSGRATQLVGAIDLGSRTLTLNAGGGVIIDGDISGSGGLVKSNTGVVTLAGDSTYTGTTRLAVGTLQIDGTLTSAVMVSPLQDQMPQLTGRGGTSDAITVESGGTLAPGVAGPGRLTGAALSLASGATLAVDLDGPAAGTQYDQVVVDGTATLDGATLVVTPRFAPAPGTPFTIVAAGAVSGTFAGLPEGAMFSAGGTPFTITYAGGAGSDVMLVSGGNPITPGASATATPTATATSTSIVPTPTATSTAPATATATTEPATPTATGEPTAETTASETPTPTPTPTVEPAACTGDCNGSGSVEINELVVGVNIALGTTGISACPAFDANGDGSVAIQELIAAVNNALSGCA